MFRSYFPCVTDYVDRLLELLFVDVVNKPESYQQLRSDIAIPPTLCSSFQRPSDADIRQITSRFGTQLDNA